MAVTAVAGDHTSGIPVVVSLAVLGSAVLHATWNALAKSVKDQLVGFVILELSAGIVALAAATFLPAPAVAAWPYLGASLALHTAYAAFLLNSYRVGELNQVYPLARGASPLVVAVLAVPLAGERLGLVRAIGVVVVGGGLISLAQLRGWWAAGRPPAVALAFVTGLLIASYTVIDGLGVRRAGTALGYAAWLMVADAVPLSLYAVIRRPARVWEGWGSAWRAASVGGLLSVGAYTIVLWAQTRGALAAVAALRETGVIVAAVIGTALFGEHFGRRRMVAAGLVAVGVVLLNLG
jgi:drug/metabolite transporter (DMT)-like permease